MDETSYEEHPQPNVQPGDSLSNVTELPVGRYDAVRTLRHLLAQAERGEFDSVIVICGKANPDPDAVGGGFYSIWACWSHLLNIDVLWACRWFNSFINNRYFGKHHD